MTGQEAFSEYSRKRLGGRPIPDDLRALLKMQWQRPSTPPSDDEEAPDPLAFIDARLLEADESHDLLDHSYLTPKDLQNPDIAANVDAIKSVCQYAAFVAVDTAGDLFGYWFGPEQLPIEAAPIVRFDTEGSFSLVTGRALAESLLGYSPYDEDEDYTELRAWFTKLGVNIEPARWKDAGSHTAPTDPDEMHSRLYNEGRRARGLPPIKD
jgi:hypothetical protein